ncbi:hypothetical protein [Nocardioides alcanivorans]|uniref:hypothetical protein n=1 Tax=Nocardioides alcanivorans TaxID=2897352 RepID=UPI0035E2EDA3
MVRNPTGVTNTGGHGNNDRIGSCEGGTPTALTDTPIDTSATALPTAAAILASGGTASFCVVVGLSPDAPNSMQSKSTTLAFSIEAEQ